ncbi:MAG: hypothetical protein BMS9Abin37_0905 [Acidobacteriota bacterium]|nr:MAG: hypothetical protein BMS9Abin37_0905 [Acidobacteriota bacterium]
MIDSDFEAYFESIEHEFFRLKGRRGTLSPADFARTREWFDAGIPIDAVLEGMAGAFQALSAGREGESVQVNSLAYCDPFVEQAIARRRSL